MKIKKLNQVSKSLVLMWLLVLQNLGNPLYAQEDIVIHQEFKSVDLSESNILWWEDTTHTLELKDILELNQLNKMLIPPSLGLGYNPHHHWIKFSVKTTHPNTQLIISPLVRVGKISIYHQKSGRWQQQTQETEDFYNQLLFKARYFNFFCELDKVGKHDIYMKIESKRVSIKLRSEVAALTYFHNRGIVNEYFFGILFGGIIIMAIYNFFLFLSIRDKNYLYYFFVIFSNFLMQLSLNNHFLFFFKDSQLWWKYGNTLTFIFMLSLLWFTVNFLETRKNNLLIHKLSQLFMLFNGAMIFLSLVLPIIWVIKIANLNAMLSALFGLVVCILLLFQKVRVARFFALSWLFFIVGGALLPLANFGLLPFNFFTVNSILLGGVIEVIFLSFALADKINLLTEEKNKAQQKALQSVQENARLIKEQNQILEEKVEERTRNLAEKNAEIVTQNNEITTLAEELQQQAEELATQRDFIEERNKILELKNRQISHSLNAALTIQQAVMPDNEKLKKILKDYFVIYQPKDVVSGDFYWLNTIELPLKRKSINIMAVVDCTGHGIPGAFMTLIGNTLLDKIVTVWHIYDPAQILIKLHEEIQIMLKQQNHQNNYGMDMSIIAWEKLNTEAYKIIFSGAKSGICCYNSQTKEMKCLRGERRAIGGFQNTSISFTNQEIILPNDSMIYMRTDGYADQNNQQRKRMGDTALLKLLDSNLHQNMELQKTALENALSNHMLGTSQRDDILLIGFRLSK